MNDFLRPCNCVHPAEEDCEKCIDEAAVKKMPDLGNEKEKKEPKTAENKKKDMKNPGAGLSRRSPGRGR